MKLQKNFFRFQYLLPAANAEESHCAGNDGLVNFYLKKRKFEETISITNQSLLVIKKSYHAVLIPFYFLINVCHQSLKNDIL